MIGSDFENSPRSGDSQLEPEMQLRNQIANRSTGNASGDVGQGGGGPSQPRNPQGQDRASERNQQAPPSSSAGWTVAAPTEVSAAGRGDPLVDDDDVVIEVHTFVNGVLITSSFSP